MRLAYLGRPHAGGTYSLFRHLRDSLGPSGVDLRWLAAGASAHAAAAHPQWAADTAWGRIAGAADLDDRGQSLALLEAVERDGYDAVLVNVLTSRPEMNVARYLPVGRRRVMLVHNITPGTYAAARALRDHVHATVGVSRRIRRDLVRRHGFDRTRTFAIPNAIGAIPAAPRPQHGDVLRLVFLGRVEHASKGVLLLPDILAGLGPDVTLTIAGDGPDLASLRARCAGLGRRVTFLGEVGRDQVAGILAAHDVFLMPSRYEGAPLALMEAMAAGCVPVATRLPGVTDTIVTDGHDGCLVPPGNAAAARRAVHTLDASRAMLHRMSQAAAETARIQFRAGPMAAAYLEALDAAFAAPPVRALDPADWQVPAGMRMGWRGLVPAPAKAWLLALRERMA